MWFEDDWDASRAADGYLPSATLFGTGEELIRPLFSMASLNLILNSEFMDADCAELQYSSDSLGKKTLVPEMVVGEGFSKSKRVLVPPNSIHWQSMVLCFTEARIVTEKERE